MRSPLQLLSPEAMVCISVGTSHLNIMQFASSRYACPVSSSRLQQLVQQALQQALPQALQQLHELQPNQLLHHMM